MADTSGIAPFVAALLGAVTGGTISLFVQRWKYSADRWTAMGDELGKEIVALADLASEWWLQSRAADPEQMMALQQMRIRGALERLNELKIPFEDWCRHHDGLDFQSKFGAFNDAISGGDFTRSRRAANPEQAFRVQVAAADAIGSIRRGIRQGLGWRAAGERLVRRATSGRSRNRTAA